MKALILGATGAVGTALTKELLAQPSVTALTLLLRRKHSDPSIASSRKLTQHIVDVFNPASYESFIAGHELAFSTLGVGEPSKISKEEFVKVDLTCVQTFATACKKHGVQSFSSLGAVGADPHAKIFYLRIKGQLEQALIDLKFPHLDLFRPSMIMTPENRYGFTQALALKFYPYLDHLLVGGLKRYRSIHVEDLGRTMARHAIGPHTQAVQVLSWEDFFKEGR